jgi:methyltransferase (TIGR00027 family)
MGENQVSRTALWNAYLRAYHAIHDTPKIFDDFLAYHLLAEEKRASFDKQMVTDLKCFNPALAASFPDIAAAKAYIIKSSAAASITLSRARYTEDSLEEAVRQGVKQYVILGAGMDTFAFRRPEMLEQIQVFEVDHPATQAFKRRRLTELGWECPAQLHFVPVDFTQDCLIEALTRSAYDQQAPSFFSWLGVTYYLPREAVFATLQAIADIASSGSTVIFDYMDTNAFVPEKAAPRVQILLWAVKREGETMKAGFDSSTLAADFARLGLRLLEDLNPADIQERFFQGRTDGYHACEHVHFSWAVVDD